MRGGFQPPLKLGRSKMNGYMEHVKDILELGVSEDPRGLRTLSRKNASLRIFTGRTYRRYKDNPLIGFMEGLQFIAGTFNQSEIARIAPNAKLDLFGPTSSYGLRVGDQVFWIIDELLSDPYSRRAVLVLPDPNERLEERPCTISMQFVIRRGNFMDTIVSMRSSDAVYGLPYDFIQFSMMSIVIAQCANKIAGETIINIGNAHIYESTRHLAKDFAEWGFSIPAFQELVDYEKWALSTMPILTADNVEEIFNFHPVQDV